MACGGPSTCPSSDIAFTMNITALVSCSACSESETVSERVRKGVEIYSQFCRGHASRRCACHNTDLQFSRAYSFTAQAVITLSKWPEYSTFHSRSETD